MNINQVKDFQYKLNHWYKVNGRDLPWRHTKNPYDIWISEIMLQQTQVDTVKGYYERFISKFPTSKELAQASEDQVFKMWEGLGYYRRASNMMAAARTIEDEFDGKFPDTYDDIIKLKGIGQYTASAIASISYGIEKGVVDGNTLRIISRLYDRQDNIALDKTKKEYQKIMDELIKNSDPSDFNQAMMDLGAMICTPKHARCSECPVAEYCDALKNQTVALLPVNIKKRSKTDIELITAVLMYDNQYFMVKKHEGLLQNLYGLVQYEVESPAAFEDMFYDEYGLNVRLMDYVKTVKHVFTHKVWNMNVYYGQILGELNQIKACDFGLYTRKELSEIAISTAHQKALKYF